MGQDWRNSRFHWGLALALAAILFGYPLLVDIPLLDPDEGLHASISQEMVERGDWVTPRLHGRPFFDKPVLFFWAQAVSLSLLGMNEAAVRLPGLLFGLCGPLTTGLLGWRLFHREAGILAGICHATMVLPTALAQAAVHDVALVPWTNLSLLFMWEADRSPTRRARARHRVAAGIVLGLALLTKGLMGLAFVGLAWGLYLVVARRLSVRACLGLATVFGIAGLVAAPWYYLMDRANPGYFYYYFVERHLLGYVTEGQRHGQASAWYYLPVLIGGGLPWIAALPMAFRDWLAIRRRGEPITADRGRLLAWIWLASTFAFLSIAQSKLATYMLPLFPAVALLAADLWSRVLDGSATEPTRRRLGRWVHLGSLIGICAVPAAVAVVERRYKFEFPWLIWTGAWGVSLFAVVPSWEWLRGRPRRTVLTAAAAFAAAFVFIMTAIIPAVAHMNSARALAIRLRSLPALPSQVMITEERVGSLYFYLTPRHRVGLTEERIRKVDFEELVRIPSLPPDALIAVPPRRFKKSHDYMDLYSFPWVQVGKYRIYPADRAISHRWPQYQAEVDEMLRQAATNGRAVR